MKQWALLQKNVMMLVSFPELWPCLHTRSFCVRCFYTCSGVCFRFLRNTERATLEFRVRHHEHSSAASVLVGAGQAGRSTKFFDQEKKVSKGGLFVKN